MTGAKDRMREKKMKNQPRNVIYTSSGRGTEGGQGSQACGWVRGHQPGGHSYSQDLPKHITASFFARARAAEVNAMLKAVGKPAGSCHIFNALPKHMRRRAMSHNTKRLPRRLREGAERLAERSQRAPEKEKKQLAKSRSRRARRRHGNLLLEFNRRQRKNKWLETHIWHAKRFHMLKTWSYCLPLKPTAKSFRASYRAMNTHALLQVTLAFVCFVIANEDLSYYCCLELQGSEEQMLRALARLTSKQTGPTFAAASCLSGARQGSVHLYKADQFPQGSLGPADFLWRPRVPDASDRQLWIWIHPALRQDVLSELQLVCQCFEAVSISEESCPAVEPYAGRKRKRDEDDAEQLSKRLLGNGTRPAGTAVRWHSSDTAITISDLTMEIVRYRLIGPLAHTVLTDTLRPASEEMEVTKPSNHSTDEVDTSVHQQQADIFQLLRGVGSTAELPAGCVLGLTVDDPRLTLPQKRGKSVPDLQQSAGSRCVFMQMNQVRILAGPEILSLSHTRSTVSLHQKDSRVRDLTLRGVAAHCSQSTLWDASVRDRVTHNRPSEQELNRMRSELLVPGSRLSAAAQAGVPVLLVHQGGRVRGEERLHWGSGWDLMLPKGWGMAFWVPLVYRGVRVGGLHMSVKASQFTGQPHFPHDYPDCPAGQRFQSEQEAELLEKFKRRPPSKRTNYIKHGCLAPFRCPWQQLTEEWEELVNLSAETTSDCGTGPSDFAVLRSEVPRVGRAPHEAIDCSLSRSAVCHMISRCVCRSLKALRQLSAWCRPSSRRNSFPLTRATAAALRQECGRSLVWVRLRLLGKGQPALHATVCVPTTSDLQLLLKDAHSSGPQEPRHKDHLKHLRRHTSGPEEPACAVRGVWPPPLPSVLSHCSRLTLGWVQQGDFSLAAGHGEALAFISVSGLLHMILQQPQEQRGVVLLRNPSSLQYRYARISIDI
ncbi:Ribonucleases P/MRP protein subunit POP1 [Labeo rohita]|uniref:Ribonucleases P/MRP protein subunit POP1 n=1 Tax=Labeo rohita TaxID=84645 RepID=A0ABQ8LWQ1_LABRO|nr:Ribonucleases P/MRP protein subunit POP1 [Labeo rohita]